MSKQDKKNTYTTVRLNESNRDALKQYGATHNINVMNDIIEKLLDSESLYQPSLAGLDEKTTTSGSYKKLDKINNIKSSGIKVPGNNDNGRRPIKYKKNLLFCLIKLIGISIEIFK